MVRNGSEVKVFVSAGGAAATTTAAATSATPTVVATMAATATMASTPTVRAAPTATPVPPTPVPPTPVPPTPIPPTPMSAPSTRPSTNMGGNGTTAPLPNVVGQRPQDAENALRAAGFTNVRSMSVSDVGGGAARGVVYQVAGGPNALPLAPGQQYPKDTQIFILYQG